MELNVVGTENATEDVYHHVKPGKTRAPFFRYFRFNLPRLTKLALLVVIAGIGLAAFTVARSSQLPFDYAGVPLAIVIGAAAVFVVVGVATKARIWDLGFLVSLAALATYVGGIFGDAPYVWNGASAPLAAMWNLMLLLSLAYLVAYWALHYGIIVAYPDDQHFQD